MNTPTFDDLARLAAIDYKHIDWRMAFADLHTARQAEKSGLLATIADLETKLLAATSAPATPESAVAAAAQSLAELTGESCLVEVAAWYYPDHTTSPILRVTHGAYRSGQYHGAYEGDTIEDACAKVREDWERANTPAATPTVDPATETDHAIEDLPY